MYLQTLTILASLVPIKSSHSGSLQKKKQQRRFQNIARTYQKINLDHLKQWHFSRWSMLLMKTSFPKFREPVFYVLKRLNSQQPSPVGNVLIISWKFDVRLVYPQCDI